jgi:hypothetical protein
MAAAGRKHEYTYVELFFIKGHIDKMTPEEIQGHLKLTNLEQLKEKIEELKVTKLPTAGDQMIRKDKRAVAMTPVASEMGDYERRKSPSTLIGKNCIHEIGKD